MSRIGMSDEEQLRLALAELMRLGLVALVDGRIMVRASDAERILGVLSALDHVGAGVTITHYGNQTLN
jgi:hypothetical protein